MTHIEHKKKCNIDKTKNFFILSHIANEIRPQRALMAIYSLDQDPRYHAKNG